MTGRRPVRYAIGGAACLLASSIATAAESPRDEESKRLDQVERALAEDQAKAEALEKKAEALKAEVEALQHDMVAAARALGGGHLRIVVRHILPSAMAPVLVTAAFAVGAAIGLEAALSFLGLGVRPPVATWGGPRSSAMAL